MLSLLVVIFIRRRWNLVSAHIELAKLYLLWKRYNYLMNTPISLLMVGQRITYTKQDMKFALSRVLPLRKSMNMLIDHSDELRYFLLDDELKSMYESTRIELHGGATTLEKSNYGYLRNEFLRIDKRLTKLKAHKLIKRAKA